ncbi:glycosyltransferase family 2 protein [Lacrimispora celerecrescens]|uniref:Glycosyltransferase involved in cell wall biosynthesis n=2 Tax=Lacrimispora celerecrescens TaxID=29354 RepID=A0A2M8Z8X0_9FIRM|nr:glycosyltransferase family 2 protein [Lacrimispora celerecrescens]PJJ29886.1 glycosyltransferase involved in cell wall biosynthesis [[Clostridium] celerecrescens 18A]
MIFSIIIPIYNVEKYLKKCVTSITNQKFNDYEIIMIDDYSTDNSLKIAEEYTNDKNIRLIKKKKNMGLSDTRNVGIDNSSGDYLIFLDSDDYIEDGALDLLSNVIIDQGFPDIIYTGFVEERENVAETKFGYVSKRESLYDREGFLKSELSNRTLYAPACFGVYKRSLIVENRVYFKLGLLHEDELWTPSILMRAHTIYTSGIAFYHYVRRDNSITKTKDKTQNGIDLICTCYELIRVSNMIHNKHIRKLFRNHIAMLYMKGTAIGKLYKKNDGVCIDRFLPFKLSCMKKDIAKALLFMVSTRAYCILNERLGEQNGN